MHVFFIAEAGVNHNGDLEIAKRLIEAAAKAGADAVKFQTFKASETVVSGTETVAYQKKGAKENDQFMLLKNLELSETDHLALRKCCDDNGIEFMSTAFDIESAYLLRDLGVQRFKVPSGELTNIPFLSSLAALGRPMILSTGMATLEEVKRAVNTIAKAKNKCAMELADDMAILHCTSSYPAPDYSLNLLAIKTLASTFQVPVGYSDHSDGITAALLSMGMGATVYEKHITLDKNMSGPDHAASMDPDELSYLVAMMRRASVMMGDGIKVPQSCELEARLLVRRSLVAAYDLPAGHKLVSGDIQILRPGSGIPPCDLSRAIGASLRVSYQAGQPLLEADLDGF